MWGWAHLWGRADLGALWGGPCPRRAPHIPFPPVLPHSDLTTLTAAAYQQGLVHSGGHVLNMQGALWGAYVALVGR